MIGTPFGPEYSNLAVGKFELYIAERYNGPIPEFCKQYIDDIVGATSMLRVELDQFIDCECNFNPAFSLLLMYLRKKLYFCI